MKKLLLIIICLTTYNIFVCLNAKQSPFVTVNVFYEEQLKPNSGFTTVKDAVDANRQLSWILGQLNDESKRYDNCTCDATTTKGGAKTVAFIQCSCPRKNS